MPSEHFAIFAARLFEHKVNESDIKSAMVRNKWHYTLKQLIEAFAEGRARPDDRERLPQRPARRDEGGAPEAPARARCDVVTDLDTSEHEVYT